MTVKYSVVVPCFNEESTVNIFYDAIIPIMEQTKEKFEIIFINDGSRDNTELKLKEICEKDKRVKLINFSRNFGQQAALLAGFSEAKGEAIIDIDVDLQDPVEAILPMIEKWKEGYDVVHGKRTSRKGESFLKKATSTLYTKWYKKVTGLELPKNCGDFKLFDRKVIDTIISMPEKHRFLRGITKWVGFKQTYVEFERQERVAGETKYTAKKLFKLATDGVVTNSTYPLSISLKFGIFGTILSLATFLTFIILAICSITLPLTAWLFPSISLLFSISYIFNGLSNIYLGRTYEEAKNRPVYIIREKINFDK